MVIPSAATVNSATNTVDRRARPSAMQDLPSGLVQSGDCPPISGVSFAGPGRVNEGWEKFTPPSPNGRTSFIEGTSGREILGAVVRQELEIGRRRVGEGQSFRVGGGLP